MYSQLFVGNLENKNIVNFNSNDKTSICLENLPKRNLLFSGLPNGSVVIYRTGRLPKLQILYSTRGYQVRSLSKVQNITINGKDYVIATSGHDCTIRIWHLIKGKMRLLRVVSERKDFSYGLFREL